MLTAQATATVQETDVIRGADAVDLIALVWFRLGYRPWKSLVLVGLTGPRHQVGPILRVDLPSSRKRREVIRGLADVLLRHGQESVVVLVVSDRRGSTHRAEGTPARRGRDGEDPPPQLSRGLVRALLEELSRDLDVLDVLSVGPTSFRSCLCPDPTCCPPGGIPLSQAMTSRVATRMVTMGQVVRDDESELVSDVIPMEVKNVPDGPVPPDGEDASRRMDAAQWSASQALACWRTLLAGTGPVPPDLRWLGRELESTLFRDALMLTLLPGSGSAAEDLLAGRREAFDHDLTACEPEQVLYERGRCLLAVWVKQALEGSRAPGLTVLAWMAWWRGDTVRSRLLVERALHDRPEYRLAKLVRDLLAAGIPPDWISSALSDSCSSCVDPDPEQSDRVPDHGDRWPVDSSGASGDRPRVADLPTNRPEDQNGGGECRAETRVPDPSPDLDPLLEPSADHGGPKARGVAGNEEGGLTCVQVTSTSVKPRLAGRQPSTAAGCPG
jgi:hypothetical protein